MKKTSIHMCILFLICFTLFSSFFLDDRNENNMNTSSFHNTIPLQASIPDGYVEDNFTTVEIPESNIRYDGEQIIEVEGSKDMVYDSIYQLDYIPCSSSIIDYPSNNNSLWHISLPEGYEDATSYYIRRSDVEVYYPIQDELNPSSSKIHDSDTYWEIPTYSKSSDIIHYELELPILNYEVFTDDYHWEVKLSFNRFENKYRDYDDIKVKFQIPKPFDNVNLTLFDMTGGDIFKTDITNESLKFDISQELINSKIFDILNFELSLGMIYESVDHEFILEMTQEVVLPSFFEASASNWIYLFAIPLLGITGGLMFSKIRADKSMDLDWKYLSGKNILWMVGGMVVVAIPIVLLLWDFYQKDIEKLRVQAYLLNGIF